tara:strand:- start:133 stop:330 length:198 start_codon:yes stop_codon:yes gene_type:complete
VSQIFVNPGNLGKRVAIIGAGGIGHDVAEYLSSDDLKGIYFNLFIYLSIYVYVYERKTERHSNPD